MSIGKTLFGFIFLGAWLVWMPPAMRAQSREASTSEVLTLQQAIELALRDNSPVKNASLEVRKAQEQLDAMRTQRWPSFHIDVLGAQLLRPIDVIFPQGIWGLFPGIGPVPAQNTDIRTGLKPALIADGRVAQPLSQLYRINLALTQLKLNREIAKEKLREDQHQITREVKQAYFAITQTQSAQRISNATIKFYRHLDSVTDAYVAQETALKVDSLDIKVHLAKAEYDALTLDDRLALQKQQLNRLLGRDVLTEFSVSPVPEESEYEIDLATARRQAMERRPELREAHLRVQEAEGDRRMKKAEYIPDASLRFQYASLRGFNEVVPKEIALLGVNLKWEVFDWGRKRHELNEKDLTIEQTRNALREAETSIQIEVDDKLRKLQRTRQLLRIAQLSQQASLENLRLSTERYQAQASLVKDVLQAQGAVEQANDQYQQALSAFWTAKAEFEKAIGEDQ